LECLSLGWEENFLRKMPTAELNHINSSSSDHPTALLMPVGGSDHDFGQREVGTTDFHGYYGSVPLSVLIRRRPRESMVPAKLFMETRP